MNEQEFEKRYESTCTLVLDELREALNKVDLQALHCLARDMLDAKRVFFIGVGRVMLSLEAMAKRFSHLGMNCVCVGDITEPAITAGDLLIVGSGSGTSVVPLAIARKAREWNAKIVHIGSNPHSEMKDLAAYMVRVPVQTRLYLPGEIPSRQIMTSLFEQTLLLLGDILAEMIADEKGLDLQSLWQFHANLE